MINIRKGFGPEYDKVPSVEDAQNITGNSVKGESSLNFPLVDNLNKEENQVFKDELNKVLSYLERDGNSRGIRSFIFFIISLKESADTTQDFSDYYQERIFDKIYDAFVVVGNKVENLDEFSIFKRNVISLLNEVYKFLLIIYSDTESENATEKIILAGSSSNFIKTICATIIDKVQVENLFLLSDALESAIDEVGKD